ncbi:MAG: glycoside hydrolase family 13 protein [Lachnospiraceae bacterium]
MESNQLIKEALFTSETRDYRRPEEPEPGDSVMLRFRTGKQNASHVFIGIHGADILKEIPKVESDDLFDYYSGSIEVGKDQVRYYFQIIYNGEVCYFNRLGATLDNREQFAFCITPGFHTPEWAKGAVMYQIYVDRFCNGNRGNDVVDNEYVYIGHPVRQVQEWDSNPEPMDVRRFYGGDLQGVLDKLNYIQSLGVTAIYFNPLFVSPSNHKYDIQDYEHIDPHFGVIIENGKSLVEPDGTGNENAEKYVARTASRENLEASDALFLQLVKEMHRRGMRVIIDGVFNHCGSFNKWLDRERIYEREGSYESGAYVSFDSPYHTFFHFNENRPENWPYNGSYDGWWGHDTLPKLNYEGSPVLEQYVLDIAKKWVSEPYCVDGWRLDVAADLGHSAEYNHWFWQKFRRTVKKANPEALILAEHYGDPSSWLQGDQWDSVMNYDAFMEPLTWFLTGMEKHSDEYREELLGDGREFFASMMYNMSRMQTNSLLVAMNELSNHDHSRFLTRTNHMAGRIGELTPEDASKDVNLGVMREAVMVQMTWPGAPAIYYGDEAGLCGFTDPDSRRTYPWGHENLELIEYHRYMTRIHNQIPALKRGALKPLLADYQVIAYGRIDGEYKCVIVLNNDSHERSIEVPVWELGIGDDTGLSRIMMSTEVGYNAGVLPVSVKEGKLALTMPKVSSALFITRAGDFY